MRERPLWELESEQIAVATSEAAQLETWAGILAGLGGVEPARFKDLARKAILLAQEYMGQHPDLMELVQDRIDELWSEHESREET